MEFFLPLAAAVVSTAITAATAVVVAEQQEMRATNKKRLVEVLGFKDMFMDESECVFWDRSTGYAPHENSHTKKAYLKIGVNVPFEVIMWIEFSHIDFIMGENENGDNFFIVILNFGKVTVFEPTGRQGEYSFDPSNLSGSVHGVLRFQKKDTTVIETVLEISGGKANYLIHFPSHEPEPLPSDAAASDPAPGPHKSVFLGEFLSKYSGPEEWSERPCAGKTTDIDLVNTVLHADTCGKPDSVWCEAGDWFAGKNRDKLSMVFPADSRFYDNQQITVDVKVWRRNDGAGQIHHIYACDDSFEYMILVLCFEELDLFIEQPDDHFLFNEINHQAVRCRIMYSSAGTDFKLGYHRGL